MTTAAAITPALRRQQRWNTRLLAFVLVYTAAAGAVRKWLLLGGALSNVLLLIQILLPWIFYAMAAGRRARYGPLLLLTAGILTLMAFNPLNQTLFHGLFGLLLHLGFWLIGFHYLENRHLYPWEKLQHLLFLIFFLEIALGIVQYNLPRSHFLNKYAAEGVTSIAFVGEAARITGTFSFVAGFTSWLIFVNFWTWSLALCKEKLYRINLVIGLSLLASLLSGARLALAFTLFFALITYQDMFQRLAWKKLVAGLLAGFITMAVLYRQSSFVQNAWANFYSRIEDGFRDKEYGRRTVGILGEVVDYKGDYPVFGTGLGGTYQGARLIWGESYFLKNYGGYEEEPERIILEGGMVLLAIRALLLMLFLYALRIPVLYKLVFFVLIFFFTQSIFNIYNIIFITLGLSLADWGYGHKGQPETPYRRPA